MEYVSIGTDKLLEEYYYHPVNSSKVYKPIGGLWNSVFYSPCFNEWLDFIMDRPVYYTNYMLKEDPFKMKCVIISLKDGTKVLDMSSKEGFEEISKKYQFDFERVSDDYDGIFFNPFEMLGSRSSMIEEIVRLYSVKSLCLFDFEKIKEYKKGLIDIEPFDYTDGYNYGVPYDTKIQDGTFHVEKASDEYRRFWEMTYIKLRDYVYNLRKAHPEFPSYKLVDLIKEELVRAFEGDIQRYAAEKGLNENRISYSLALRAYKKIK